MQESIVTPIAILLCRSFFSFGPFTGGMLRTVGGELNIYRQATLFRGDKGHWVEDHDGLRHSIALYSHKRAAEISFEMEE